MLLTKRTPLTTALALFICSFSLPTLADRIYWGCGFAPTILSAGALTCRQTVTCESKSLSCKQGDKTLFAVDAFADYLAVSDKGQYLVGLSNRGVHPLFWLRKFSGEPINLAPVSAIHFCSESVTNVREWFDKDRPEVRFVFKDGTLSGVTVRACDGREVLFNANE